MLAALLLLLCCCCFCRKRSKPKKQQQQFIAEEPKGPPIPGGGARTFRDTGYQAPAAVLATANTVRCVSSSQTLPQTQHGAAGMHVELSGYDQGLSIAGPVSVLDNFGLAGVSKAS